MQFNTHTKGIIKDAAFMRSQAVSPVVIVRPQVVITVPAERLTKDGGIPAFCRRSLNAIDPATTTLADIIRLNVLHGVEVAPR